MSGMMSGAPSRKRQACNEDCLARIAARLCALNEQSTLPAAEDPRRCGKGDVDNDCCGKSEVDGKNNADGMDNADGCCGESKADDDCCGENDACGPTTATTTDTTDTTAGDDGGCSSPGGVEQATDSCCKSEAKDNSCKVKATDNCCRVKPTADACAKDTTNTTECCSTAKDSTPGCAADDACCKPKSPPTQSCSSKGVVVRDSCCAPPPTVKPDCDDGCCTGQARDAGEASSAPGHLDQLQAALDRYEAVLKRGLCLCRMAIEQLGFNCCAPTGAHGVAEESNPSVEVVVAKKVPISTETEIHPRCSSDLPRARRERDNKHSAAKQSVGVDVEKAAGHEHVVLTVTGMTCTGCSRKMMNVLTPIPGLSNADVTFVSGSAEFDFDTNVGGEVDKVLLRIEKETGFKCFRVISGRQELSVLMTPATAKHLQNAALPGLVSVTEGKGKGKGKKNGYEISYDPTAIGARDLLPPDSELAPPTEPAGITEGKRRLIKTACSTGLAAVLTIPVVVLEWSDNPVPHDTIAITTLVLGTCVQLIAVPEFYVGALKSLIYSHVMEMDMLVVISITAAYVYSVVAFGLQRAGVTLEQEAFFETSTLLITFVLLGRLIAAWARMRAVSAVSLRSLQAENATLIGEKGDTTTIDARLLQFGDSIAIAPHSRIVTDGAVISGASEVDESMVTGESLPVAKGRGDSVIAGTMNGSGNLHVAITRLPGENSITDIATLVENAVASKPRVQELADKVASWFIPAVVGIAVVVFCIWLGIALDIRNRNAGGAVGMSITYAIAVLAVSCPCALGLAVPMVLVIAGGIAARAGVIIKAADAVERSYQVTDVVFDKTGTLTEGDLHVVLEELLPSKILTAEETQSLAWAMVEGNTHPVSVSVAAHLQTNHAGLVKKALESVTSIPGAGLEAVFENHHVKAGNPHWLGLDGHPRVSQLLRDAMTLFCVTINGELVAIFGLKSTLRSNAAAVVAEFARRKIACHIVSGDNAAAVLDVAHSFNVAEANVLSHSSPAQKQQYVQNLQASGKKVLFLGDGTNDAVAISQANVGVQMGSASDVTGAVADVVLLSHNLESLLALLDLSRAAVRRIFFNFAWSAIYNIFAILLAAGAFVKFRIEPAYAGLGELVSVLPVIIAAGTLAIGRKRM